MFNVQKLNKKVDVIIPVFKLDGLEVSLKSVENYSIAKVVIVDDGQFNNYKEIIDKFKDTIDFSFIQLVNNSGQGLARQYGFEHSYSDFLTFLDCGDEIYKNSLEQYYYGMEDERLNLTDRNSVCVYKDKTVEECFGTLGQMYRRKWVKEFNINHCFNIEASHRNEDSCWYNQCVYIRKYFTHEDVFQNMNSLVKKNMNENSISQANGQEYHLRDNNIGVYYNFPYVYRKLEKLFAFKGWEFVPSIFLDFANMSLIGCIWNYFENIQYNKPFVDLSFYWLKKYYIDFYSKKYKANANQLWMIYCRTKNTFTDYKPIKINNKDFEYILNLIKE